jgi:hypothetical protein
MSIEAVLLIVILTFGFGSALNRWEMRPGQLRRADGRADPVRAILSPDEFGSGSYEGSWEG